MATAADALALLSSPWRVAFEQAWLSWRDGNFGIGAVLVEPVDESIVAVGRNRVAQTTAEPGLLSGNMTAHAEMNALATLPRINADGLHLYTTLEPCLMCAATSLLMKVAHVHFAVGDEFFEGLDDLWARHPVTKARQPSRTGPFEGSLTRLAQFARLMPLAFTLDRFPGRPSEEAARNRHPGLASLVDDLRRSGAIDELFAQDTLTVALDLVWDRLAG